MFRPIGRISSQFSLFQKRALNIHANPFKAKRPWPPDFSDLSIKHKLRLEKRYRRRAKLKYARPRWTKAIKLAQAGSILFVIVYGVLFLDWNTESKDPPFKAARDWYKSLADSLWTHTSKEAGRSVSQNQRVESGSASRS